jgi:hypothetical protein
LIPTNINPRFSLIYKAKKLKCPTESLKPQDTVPLDSSQEREQEPTEVELDPSQRMTRRRLLISPLSQDGRLV